MKIKTVLILFLVAGILSAAALLIMKKDDPKDRFRMGEKLFSDFPINQIFEVAIMDTDNAVHLKKGDNIWRVAEKSGFPADFSRLADMIRKLGRAKTGRKFDGSDTVLARLKLKDPENKDISKDETGVKIILKGKDGVIFETLILGSARSGSAGSGGQYLKTAKSDQVFLIDESFRFLKKSPSEWIQTDILKINEADIQMVESFKAGDAAPVYAIERKEKGGKAKLMAPPDGKTVSASKISQVFEALSPLSITNVSIIKSGDLAQHPLNRLDYTTFDGKKVSIFPFEEKDSEDPYRLFINIANTPADKPLDQEKQDIDLSKWEFEIPKWQFESLMTKKENLLE